MPGESKADLKKRTAKIAGVLKKRYPNARTALRYANPLELLVATILSAQCTDQRVNMVTRGLFAKYRTARDYADVPPLRGIIYTDSSSSVIDVSVDVAPLGPGAPLDPGVPDA